MTLLAQSARRRRLPIPNQGVTPTPIVSSSSVSVLVNQSGYDSGRPKFASVLNVPDGTRALVKDVATNQAVKSAWVENGKVDFTSLDTPGLYCIEAGEAVSYHFRIGKFWNQRVSTEPALAFMNHARSDTFLVGSAGIAWRDSHQFSFELHGLVAQYAANPAAYTRMPYGITSASTSEYADLRTQSEPDIVWLMKFAAHRYVALAAGGAQLHALTKGQIPFLLWLYPYISQWVNVTLYESLRDVAVNQWATTTTNLSWYDTGTSNDMFATQQSFGPAKGSEPPGHKIVPNLLMWQVAEADGLANPTAYRDAAITNASWLVNSVDPADPLATKNQRMSEHITLTGLSYLYEMFPEHAPAGTLAWVEAWADTVVARSQNMWDFRMYSSVMAGDNADRWTNLGDSQTPGGGGYNEPGSIAGLPAPIHAARRVLTDPTVNATLARIAQAQFDAVFGRNPRGRHFSYAATTEIEGVDLGWHDRYVGGNGALGSVPGVLDGAPVEGNYPFDPTVTGYTEGWVAFNSAWNHALAYDAAADVEVSVLQGGVAVTSATQGSTVTLKLRAPLNFNEAVIESGWVEVSVDGGTPTQVAVTEASVDDWYFTADWTVPAGASFTVGYGYGLFRQEATVTIH